MMNNDDMFWYGKVLDKKNDETKKNGYTKETPRDRRLSYIEIPCGKCKECKKKRKEMWRLRIENELIFRHILNGGMQQNSINRHSEFLAIPKTINNRLGSHASSFIFSNKKNFAMFSVLRIRSSSPFAGLATMA